MSCPFPSRKNDTFNGLAVKNLTACQIDTDYINSELFDGPTTARTVAVPITGLYAAIPFFGARLRGPILGTPFDIATGGSVPELSIVIDTVLGDRVVSTKKITRMRLSYDTSYTRVPVINDPLAAGAVVSYFQADVIVLNVLSQLVSNHQKGIPNVNTWHVTTPTEWADINPGTQISFLTAENFFTGSTVTLGAADNLILISFAY